MGWIVGGYLALVAAFFWFNWRFWDHLENTPHNNIKGLDTE